jgi:sulfate adenylyltransferase
MTAKIELLRRQYLEFEKIGLGAFAPLTGFMREDEFAGVVEAMRLTDGQLFPLPVVLDLTREQAAGLRPGTRLVASFESVEVGDVVVDSVFGWDKTKVSEQVFGTGDLRHPGVAHYQRLGDVLVGGRVSLRRRMPWAFSDLDWAPAESRAYFAERGWETVVGFQTRNVPHRAHEYLLRLALEQADGLFVQPLVGLKKAGDFDPGAVVTAYRTLLRDFLPPDRVRLGVLSTTMRYAGPKEALFHAIIRRNYGCTHFIVGRDHAGVGTYYGLYEAHDLTRRYAGELGIEVLRFAGPFYCRACDGIATERTCAHGPDVRRTISGTDVRSILRDHRQCPSELIRPEIVQSIADLPLFVEEGE